MWDTDAVWISHDPTLDGKLVQEARSASSATSVVRAKVAISRGRLVACPGTPSSMAFWSVLR
jgi:hypothetical protein